MGNFSKLRSIAPFWTCSQKKQWLRENIATSETGAACIVRILSVYGCCPADVQLLFVVHFSEWTFLPRSDPVGTLRTLKTPEWPTLMAVSGETSSFYSRWVHTVFAWIRQFDNEPWVVVLRWLQCFDVNNSCVWNKSLLHIERISVLFFFIYLFIIYSFIHNSQVAPEEDVST